MHSPLLHVKAKGDSLQLEGKPNELEMLEYSSAMILADKSSKSDSNDHDKHKCQGSV